MKTIAVILAVVVCSLCTPLLADNADKNAIQAITKPSSEVTISFTHPGRIAKMMVKEGDNIKKGQQVAEQDNSEEKAALDLAIQQAKDETRVGAQREVEAHKKQVYENKKSSGVAGAAEIAEALLDWRVGTANVALSIFEHEQDARKQKQAEAALEKTKLMSPIDGRVEEIMIKEGENVDAQNLKTMRIVNINPLWVEVPVPFKLAEKLQNGDASSVTFSSNETRTGKIVYIRDVADAASDTRLIRVEVENSNRRAAGERVNVSFPGASKVATENH